MRYGTLLLLLGFVMVHGLAAPAAAQGSGPFARHPAISPDGSRIAFSYQGDIWTVPAGGGRAYRLTVHEAYDGHPRWSPDGRRLAFVSDRYGNDDLFVMDAEGGAPHRLTYHSADDLVTDWTRDGRLLFTTVRTYAQVEREDEIYYVRPEGGTPDRLLDALGYNPTASPDGRFIAFERGSNSPTRKHYRGPANRDIWIYDTTTGAYTQLTDFGGNDFNPAWGDGRTLFFVSERDGAYNLYRLALDAAGRAAGDALQLTHFDDDGPRYFTLSADGSAIAFEQGTDLHVLSPSDGTPRRLDLRLGGDYRFDPVERKTFARDAEEYAVSPDGAYLALVVRGELFVTENDPERKRTVRLTEHPFYDRDVAWLGEHALLFSSDRDGQYDLYRLESADPQEPNLFKSLRHRTIRLTDTPEDERTPRVSPDGERVAFLRGRGQLVVAAVDEGRLADERLLLDGWAIPSGVAWSPDSRWLAYSLDDLQFNEEIYIHAVDGSQAPVNVSQHPKPDVSPVWSPDGRKLAFASLRASGDADIWFVWLRAADWEKTPQDWDELDDDPAGEDDDKQKEKEKKKEEKIVTVEIDFDRIHERLVQVTALPGGETDPAFSKDGETLFFVNNRSGRTQRFDAEQDLYSIQWDGKEMKRLTQGGVSPSDVRLGPKGKYVYLMQGNGQPARVLPEGGKKDMLPFSARMDIRHDDEQRQVFLEAWRALAQGFYDPQHHGVDWEAMREKYLPWAAKASTKRDFRDVFNIMLGELNASHLGLYGPDRSETQTERTGLLGVELDPVDGGVRVERVVPRSPADRAASRLHPGDVITAVDGESVAASDNFYRLLTDRVDELTLLSVRNAAGETREVTIRPTASLRSELYDEWVRDRQRLTEQYSNGRLGYIHIQGMNWPSFERFERELVASGSGKDGLVVDVRFNGGGWTTDYLLAVLTVRQHAYTVPRGAAENLAKAHRDFRPHYPYGERLPLAAWPHPVVALCNQNSFSNAEIFSHAFKNLDLGTLVGTPTFGAVISTGAVRLLDGSRVRLPFRGWYVHADDTNMENGPAVPDVIVENPPDARAHDADPQLKRAVDVLLGQIDPSVAPTGG